MRLKFILIFIVGSIIIISGFIYEKEYKINNFLENKTKKYARAYSTVFSSQNDLAHFVYMNLTHDKRIMTIYEKLQTANSDKKAILRDELLQLTENKFNSIKKYKINQLQFHLKDNTSFLRLSKPSAFGDDLSKIRPTIAYTNKYHKPISGVEQGKLYSAYRYIFPITSMQTKEHLGSIGLSFTIDGFLTKIMKEYGGQSCFMINKELINEKVFLNQRDRYKMSHIKGYYCDREILNALKEFNLKGITSSKPSLKILNKINKIIKSGKIKTIYNKRTKSTVTIIPIINPVTSKQIAFIKIANKAPFILNKTINAYILICLSLLLLAAILLFIYKQNISKMAIKKERNLVQNILNATPNITFVTDFKTIEYCNSVFLSFFNITSKEKFNEVHSNMLDIFLPWDDYLHKSEDMDFEEFTQLIINTTEIKRKIMVFDKSFNLASFSVGISKVQYNHHNSYLLTLTNITEHEIHKKKIEHKAYHDGLTNVFNRNKFNELFEIELRKAKRYQIPFCVAMLDIDHFKNFNDTYGHLIGDEVLISLANEVNSHVRDTDTFARWGGEEFTILFSDTNIEMAINVSEKLRQNIEELEHKVAGHISASFGVTQYKDDDSLESMFKRCDDALYVAKENGRNRVEKI